MNQNQQRYAMDRIQSVLKERIETLREKHTFEVKPLTESQMLNAIRRDKVSLKWPREKIKLTTTVMDAFDFSGIEPTPGFDEKGFVAARRKIEAQAARVKDEIMLGDGKKAIELIRKFCGE